MIDGMLSGAKDNEIKEMWTACMVDQTEFQSAFENWRETAAHTHHNLKYWSLFVLQLFAILRDMTLLIRQNNWDIFVSSIL